MVRQWKSNYWQKLACYVLIRQKGKIFCTVEAAPPHHDSWRCYRRKTKIQMQNLCDMESKTKGLDTERLNIFNHSFLFCKTNQT